MDEINRIIANIRQSICQETSQSQQEMKSTTQDLYECDKCKDTEMIFDIKTQTARQCECAEKKRYRRILEHSGIAEQFQKIGFKEFQTNTDFQKEAKSTAIEYVKTFEDIEKERNNSIAFLGNCGSGKTHLSIAIANNLMAKNIGVLYMPYREMVTKIKQVIIDDIEYNRILNPYKMARVLLIDDFAKGKTTESDINIMFEIINYRYLNNKPIIISSELTQDRLLDFDEAIGSRIIEMCKKRIVEVTGVKNNFRLGV